jgi:tetratricopeptide (TPR) repeat protein
LIVDPTPNPDRETFRSPKERRESHKRAHREIRRSPLDTWLEWTVVAVVVGSVLAIGTVHVPTLLVVGTVSIAAGVLGMVVFHKEHHAWPMTLPAVGMFLLTAWSAIQAVPLPASFVAAIAPANAEVWAHVLDPFGQPGPAWHPISLDPGATWAEVLKGLAYTGMLLASSVVAFRRGAAFGVATVFASALAAGCLTIAHGISGMTKVFGLYDPLYFDSPWQMGPLLNSNHLAGYLNLGVMCGLGVLLMRKSRFPRWFSGVGVATLFALSVLAASRGAALLLPFGVIIVVLLLRSRRRQEREGVVSNRWLDILTAGAVALGAAFAALGFTTKHWKALIDEDLIKLSILEWAKPLVRDHPFLGIGRGAFETVYPAYRPNQGHVLWTHPENLPVQWAAEWGVPVAILAMLFFLWLIRPSRMGATRSSVAAGAVAGILVLAAQNFVDFSLEMPGVAISVVVLIGSCWGDTRRRGVAGWGKPVAGGRLVAVLERLRTLGSRTFVPPVAFGALGVLAVVLAGLRGMPTALNDRMMFHEMAKETPLARVEFDPLLKLAMLRHPAEPFLPLAGAERAWRVRDADPIPFLQRVFTRSKLYGRAHLLLAEILFARGARNQALMSLKFAVRDEPNLTSAAVGLAVAKDVQGDDLLRMVPDGNDGTRVLDTLGAWMHRRNPPLAKRFDEMVLKRDPGRVAPRARRAADLVAALKAKDAPNCASEEERRRCAEEIERHAVYIEGAEPDTSRAARLRAEALLALGRGEKADKVLEMACDRVKDRVECLRTRVPILVALGKDEEVDAVLEAVASLGCTSSEACARTHLWIGGVQKGRKNLGAASNAYRRATRHDPRNAGAWISLGDTATSMGMHAQAAHAYEQAWKLKPGDEGLKKKLDKARKEATSSLLPPR